MQYETAVYVASCLGDEEITRAIKRRVGLFGLRAIAREARETLNATPHATDPGAQEYVVELTRTINHATTELRVNQPEQRDLQRYGTAFPPMK